MVILKCINIYKLIPHTHTLVHTHIHKYTHIYAHTHTHIYIYIYIHKERENGWVFLISELDRFCYLKYFISLKTLYVTLLCRFWTFYVWVLIIVIKSQMFKSMAESVRPIFHRTLPWEDLAILKWHVLLKRGCNMWLRD